MDWFSSGNFDFRNIESLFEQMGVYQVVLPFLLCFTIVFAFLEKTRVLGDGDNVKKFNVVIAVIMGLLLVQVQPLVEMVNLALPKISVAIVAVVMFFIIVAMFNGDKGINGLFEKGILTGVTIVAAIFVGWAFWSSYTGAVWPEWLSWVQDNLATIIVLGVFAGILAFITGGDNGDDEAIKAKEIEAQKRRAEADKAAADAAAAKGPG